jgi:hypothetical protein
MPKANKRSYENNRNRSRKIHSRRVALKREEHRIHNHKEWDTDSILTLDN